MLTALFYIATCCQNCLAYTQAALFIHEPQWTYLTFLCCPTLLVTCWVTPRACTTTSKTTCGVSSKTFQAPERPLGRVLPLWLLALPGITFYATQLMALRATLCDQMQNDRCREQKTGRQDCKNSWSGQWWYKNFMGSVP